MLQTSTSFFLVLYRTGTSFLKYGQYQPTTSNNILILLGGSLVGLGRGSTCSNVVVPGTVPVVRQYGCFLLLFSLTFNPEEKDQRTIQLKKFGLDLVNSSLDKVRIRSRPSAKRTHNILNTWYSI